MATGGNGRVAGPLTTEPFTALNWLPWQGHWMTPLATAATVQPWCVHVDENAFS